MQRIVQTADFPVRSRQRSAVVHHFETFAHIHIVILALCRCCPNIESVQRSNVALLREDTGCRNLVVR